MLDAQNTQADAVLCFAVHYEVRLMARSRTTIHTLTTLCHVSRHCVRAVREQIAPFIVANGGLSVAQAGQTRHLEVMMRFFAASGQARRLWDAAFISALCRHYITVPLPQRIDQKLLGLIRAVRHTEGETCIYNCAICPAIAVAARLPLVNKAGDALLACLDARLSFAAVDLAHGEYQYQCASLLGELELALKMLNVPDLQRAMVTNALKLECVRRVAEPLDVWMRQLTHDDHDLYAMLQSDASLHERLDDALANRLVRLSNEDTRERVALFYARHVWTEADWDRPRALHNQLCALLKKDHGLAYQQQRLIVFFLCEALRHLCAHHTQYSDEELSRIAMLQFKWVHATAAAHEVEEDMLVDRFVGVMRERHREDVLHVLYASNVPQALSTLSQVAQRAVHMTQEATRAALSDAMLRESRDPFDLFMYQGVGSVTLTSAAMQHYLDNVTPVVACWTLVELCQFLVNCDELFPLNHWKAHIPPPLLELIAYRFQITLTRESPHSRALHTLVVHAVPCLAQLRLIDAFAPAVMRWLQQACFSYSREANARMYNIEWRCTCGREYGDCLPSLLALYEPLARDTPLAVHLAGLESAYVEFLMRQEFMATGESRDM